MRSRYQVNDHETDRAHFITSTIVEWLPVFASPACCDILVESLQYCQERKGLRIHAWVVMEPTLLRGLCHVVAGLMMGITVIATAGVNAGAAELQIVVDKSLPTAAQNALVELQRAVTAQGHAPSLATKLPGENAPATTIVVGIAGQFPETDRILTTEQVKLPGPSESLTVRKFGPGHNSLFVCGRDARGLAYALRDVARSIELTPRVEDPLAHVIEETASPQLAVRNVSIHLCNADVERRWYFDEAFWRSYFAMLALHRFNQFTLTFSDQSNYLCPLYAFLLEMPEYPSVHVADHVRDERGKQLAMLRRISELAEEHGIDFNLGIWMQAPVPKYSAPVEVTGLPEGPGLSQYCALGLRRLLEACPSIRGVQLRMNEEAGVAAEEQAAFFRPIFEAMRAAGRPVRLDLRYKGLQPATTQAAIDEKLDVTVSTKFWSEHFGLPYHPTSVDTHWRQDRYSFGALLREPRTFHVVYQLWNVGSQRLTLWGDPGYARRFAESCQLGGGSGFEVFAPLTDQGYGNLPGEWRAIDDPAYRVGTWDQERYWFFYLCFGRLGFSQQTDPEVWQREFRQRFGRAAPAIEQAYRAASEVLPLITAARLPGASEWSWWPEMDTGGPLREYMHIQPSDPAQFYAIAQWKRTPGWRWEDWDETPGYVEDRLAKRITGKWTPWMVADRFEHLASIIGTQWAAAARDVRPTAEWLMTEVDHRLLAELAHYHASKIRAATDLALYENEPKAAVRLQFAEAHARAALQAWKGVVALTAPVYRHDLVFGVAKDSPRSKLGHHHTGDWHDRLPEVEADVTYLSQLRMKLGISADSVPDYRLHSEMERELMAPWPRFRGQDGIEANWRSDGGVDILVTVPANSRLGRVILHHRPLDQTRDWNASEMHSVDGRRFQLAIPPGQIDPQFEWQGYIELLGKNTGMCWPLWEEEQPYVVLRPPAR